MFTQQIFLLNALASQNYHYNQSLDETITQNMRNSHKTNAEWYQNTIKGFMSNPLNTNQVLHLINMGYIEPKTGYLTTKGKLFLKGDLSILTDKSISYELFFKLLEAEKRNILEEVIVRLYPDMVEKLTASSINVLVDKINEGYEMNDNIAEFCYSVAIAYYNSKNTEIAAISQVNNAEPVNISNNIEIDSPEVTKKVTKSRKKNV